MSQVYTSNLVKSLQSNLHIKIGTEPKNFDTNRYGEYYFQILIFEDIAGAAKLVYGTKEALRATYGLDLSSLPTPGAIVDDDFLSGGEELKVAELVTVRFLLQGRKISQMIAYTWLNEDNIPDEIKDQTKLAKKIFNSYNIIPETYWVNYPDKVEKVQDIQIEKKLWEIKQTKNHLVYFLIEPEHVGYDSISLALLLCGQAYYKDKDSQWTRVWEPIFGTYEVVWEYVCDISWNSFYNTITDLSQSGATPKPPYAKMLLGYPPRPDEFSLGQDKIRKWATAQEFSSCDNEYPFYPQKDGAEWNNQQLKFVVSPHPYIPVTCS